MIIANYDELIKREFKMTRHGSSNEGLPIYLLGKVGDSFITMKHLQNRTYFAHLIEIPKKRISYTDIDLDSKETFDETRSLSDLELVAA